MSDDPGTPPPRGPGDLACPVCGERPGRVCRDADKAPLSVVHAARIAEWEGSKERDVFADFIESLETDIRTAFLPLVTLASDAAAKFAADAPDVASRYASRARVETVGIVNDLANLLGSAIKDAAAGSEPRT